MASNAGQPTALKKQSMNNWHFDEISAFNSATGALVRFGAWLVVNKVI